MITNVTKIEGLELRIQELYNEKAIIQIWSSAKLFASFFIKNPDITKGKRVLELGAGTGLCGISMLKTGASSCMFTDIDSKEILHLIQSNCDSNSVLEYSQIEGLDWESPDYNSQIFKQSSYDLIVASDCLYEKTLYPDLLGLLRILQTLNKSANILLSYHERGLPDPIYLYFNQYGFYAEEIKLSEEVSVESDAITLLHLRNLELSNS